MPQGMFLNFVFEIPIRQIRRPEAADFTERQLRNSQAEYLMNERIRPVAVSAFGYIFSQSFFYMFFRKQPPCYEKKKKSAIVKPRVFFLPYGNVSRQNAAAEVLL
jgi:hypothetical protein